MPESVDVMLVDDHPLLAEGLRAGLKRREISVVVADKFASEVILEQVSTVNPRLVVLDYVIPPLGVSTPLISPIRDLGSEVVILTGTDDPAIWGSLLEAGALGVMAKSEPLGELLDTIESVLEGSPFRPGKADEYRAAWRAQQTERAGRMAPFESLSNREQEIAEALVNGASPAEIATNSFVSVGTVRSQLKSIFRKLEVSSQRELAAMAREANWPEIASEE